MSIRLSLHIVVVLLKLASFIENTLITQHITDNMKCTLITVKVQFLSVLALNRRTLRIIVTNLSQTQFMQHNMHK